LAHKTVHLGFLREGGKETGARFNELLSVAKYVSKPENVARSAVLLLLPIAVHECVHGGVPKPIRWDPTDCAVIGEERVGLFLGEDGLGVQAEPSASNYGTIGRGLDDRRAWAATTHHEDRDGIHDQETN
jgi:hypothetical protein